MTKIYIKSEITNLLMTNDRAIGKALVALHNRQTDHEKAIQGTIALNGRGFTPADAEIGSSMATFFLKFNRLSEKQIAYWRKPNVRGVPRIVKYAGQLLEIANSRQAIVTIG